MVEINGMLCLVAICLVKIINNIRGGTMIEGSTMTISATRMFKLLPQFQVILLRMSAIMPTGAPLELCTSGFLDPSVDAGLDLNELC